MKKGNLNSFTCRFVTLFVLNLISRQTRRRSIQNKHGMHRCESEMSEIKTILCSISTFATMLDSNVRGSKFNWKIALLTLHLPLEKSVFESWKSSRIGGFTWASMMMLFDVDLCCRTHADWVKFGAWFIASRKHSVDGWSFSFRTQCEGSLCKHSNCESSQHTPTSVIVQQIRANSALAKFLLKFEIWSMIDRSSTVPSCDRNFESHQRSLTAPLHNNSNSKDIWKSFGSDAARDYS